MMDRRGFFSIDALFAVTLLLMVTGVLINLYQGRDQVVAWSSAADESKMVCEKLAAAINSVYANGENSELYIDLPATIDNHSYTLSFDPTHRQIIANIPGADIAAGTSKASVTCKNVVIENLDFSKKIWVHWVHLPGGNEWSGDNVEVTNA
jgi:hypothetical protein